MKAYLIGALLTLAAAPASAQVMETAGGDWSKIPAMNMNWQIVVGPEVVDRLHKLGKSGECSFDGLNRSSININVPFLVKFTENGSAEHIVVKRLDCPVAESMFARLVAKWVEGGSVKGTGINQGNWYRSNIQIASKL